MSKIQINFKGDKAELHKKLKQWCKEADRTINGRVVELIEKSLKN